MYYRKCRLLVASRSEDHTVRRRDALGGILALK
jgi:hypothetical protein